MHFQKKLWKLNYSSSGNKPKNRLTFNLLDLIIGGPITSGMWKLYLYALSLYYSQKGKNAILKIYDVRSLMK